MPPKKHIDVAVSQLFMLLNQIKVAINHIQATLPRMETRLNNLENDRHGSNYDGQKIGTDTSLLNSQIQEQVTQNDLTLRLSCLLERYQLKNTSIKTGISEFQGRSELTSEIDQVEYEDVEEDHPFDDLTATLNLDDESHGGETIELENNSTFVL